jgi:hypothetical protein
MVVKRIVPSLPSPDFAVRDPGCSGEFPVPSKKFPVPSKKFPVLRKKIPCSARLRELGCKPLIYLIDWTRKTPKRAESGKIPC